MDPWVMGRGLHGDSMPYKEPTWAPQYSYPNLWTANPRNVSGGNGTLRRELRYCGSSSYTEKKDWPLSFLT